MLLLKYVLIALSTAMFGGAAAVLAYDIYLVMRVRMAMRQAAPGQPSLTEPTVRWRSSIALVLLAWAPLLIALSILIVPEGMAGVRVSQTSGTQPGTLYPGVHFVRPLLDKVILFDTRDQLFTTGAVEDHHKEQSRQPGEGSGRLEPLKVQAKEGLAGGLAITVRY